MDKQWQDALDSCNCLDISGHADWRLPSVEELLSLIDRTQESPALPFGHPFSGGPASHHYWSSSNDAFDADYAWYVSIHSGDADTSSKMVEGIVFPVRGGRFDTDGNLVIPGKPGNMPRFTNNGNGTITDNRTGLMWIEDLKGLV